MSTRDSRRSSLRSSFSWLKSERLPGKFVKSSMAVDFGFSGSRRRLLVALEWNRLSSGFSIVR